MWLASKAERALQDTWCHRAVQKRGGDMIAGVFGVILHQVIMDTTLRSGGKVLISLDVGDFIAECSPCEYSAHGHRVY